MNEEERTTERITNKEGQRQQKYHLWELTASGFTHSFTHHTNMKNTSSLSSSLSSNDAKVDELSSNFDPKPVPITSRHIIAEILYYLYQVLYIYSKSIGFNVIYYYISYVYYMYIGYNTTTSS